MKRAHVLTICVSVLLVAALGAPAYAITFGEPDDGRHPNVGAMVLLNEEGHYVAFCSGTLIDSNSFLTASHCTDYIVNVLERGPSQLWVSFDEAINDSSSRRAVMSINTHPQYPGGAGDSHDIAVVELRNAVSLTPARLPAQGLFTRMNKRGSLVDRTFTNVGYGSQERVHEQGGGSPHIDYLDTRELSTSTFSALNKQWLRLSQNPATGDSGTCFGDSGGPNFLGGVNSNLLASITISGDSVCRSTNVTYRLDTASARAFLDDFVTLS